MLFLHRLPVHDSVFHCLSYQISFPEVPMLWKCIFVAKLPVNKIWLFGHCSSWCFKIRASSFNLIRFIPLTPSVLPHLPLMQFWMICIQRSSIGWINLSWRELSLMKEAKPPSRLACVDQFHMYSIIVWHDRCCLAETQCWALLLYFLSHSISSKCIHMPLLLLFCCHACSHCLPSLREKITYCIRCWNRFVHLKISSPKVWMSFSLVSLCVSMELDILWGELTQHSCSSVKQNRHHC